MFSKAERELHGWGRPVLEYVEKPKPEWWLKAVKTQRRKDLASRQERSELKIARIEWPRRQRQVERERAEADNADNEKYFAELEKAEWVPMLDPDGKTHEVHADDVAKALKKGWTLAA